MKRSAPRKTFFELPPLELECMKALWAQGEASVRDIRTQLSTNGRVLAYTTIETIMDRLTRKGVVARRKVGRAHRYTPVYEAATARGDAVDALVHHFFGGSRRALAAYLAGEPLPESRSRSFTPAAPAAGLRRSGAPVPVEVRTAPRPAAARKPAEAAKPTKADRSLDTSLL